MSWHALKYGEAREPFIELSVVYWLKADAAVLSCIFLEAHCELCSIL